MRWIVVTSMRGSKLGRKSEYLIRIHSQDARVMVDNRKLIWAVIQHEKQARDPGNEAWVEIREGKH